LGFVVDDDDGDAGAPKAEEEEVEVSIPIERREFIDAVASLIARSPAVK